MDKGLEVIRMGKRKKLIYSQFDLGGRYKIFTKGESNMWEFCISFSNLGKALEYYGKMFDEVAE